MPETLLKKRKAAEAVRQARAKAKKAAAKVRCERVTVSADWLIHGV